MRRTTRVFFTAMGIYHEWDVIKLYRYAIYHHHLRFFLHRPFDGGGMIVRGRYNYIFVNTIYYFPFTVERVRLKS